MKAKVKCFQPILSCLGTMKRSYRSLWPSLHEKKHLLCHTRYPHSTLSVNHNPLFLFVCFSCAHRLFDNSKLNCVEKLANNSERPKGATLGTTENVG